MKHVVLTVGRMFGSGGREIGKKVAEKCGMAYYDKELLELAAKESGMSVEVLENIDESASNSLLYSLSTGAHLFGGHFAQTAEPPLHDKLYIAQANIIKEIAQKESCVIVGRCADHLLRNMEECVKIFIYAPLEARVKRVTEVYGAKNEKDAGEQIRKTDKRRSSYYNFYSGKKWGSLENYHLSIDSSLLGIDATVDMIAEMIRRKAAD